MTSDVLLENAPTHTPTRCGTLIPFFDFVLVREPRRDRRCRALLCARARAPGHRDRSRGRQWCRVLAHVGGGPVIEGSNRALLEMFSSPERCRLEDFVGVL